MKLVTSLFLAGAAMMFCTTQAVAGNTWDMLTGQDKGPAIVELAVPNADNDVLAVILSGDGGWADLDRDFGNAFQKRGIATIGFDCFKYFWKARQPLEVSRDLETVLRHYLKVWHKKQILLVGYSFGASWLPFLTNRLPKDLQGQVRLVVLLSPAKYVNQEIKVGDWFRDINRPGGLTVPAEAAKVRQELLCVYGREEEADSVCPGLKGANMRIMPREGGHHFDHDYASIENVILKYFKMGQ